MGLGVVSVSVCKRLLCMFAEGWSLASQRWGILGPSGQLEGLRRQVFGACGHLNLVQLSPDGCLEHLPQPFSCLRPLSQMTKFPG